MLQTELHPQLFSAQPPPLLETGLLTTSNWIPCSSLGVLRLQVGATVGGLRFWFFFVQNALPPPPHGSDKDQLSVSWQSNPRVRSFLDGDFQILSDDQGPRERGLGANPRVCSFILLNPSPCVWRQCHPCTFYLGDKVLFKQGMYTCPSP